MVARFVCVLYIASTRGPLQFPVQNFRLFALSAEDFEPSARPLEIGARAQARAIPVSWLCPMYCHAR